MIDPGFPPSGVELRVELDDVSTTLLAPEGDHITNRLIETGEFYESGLLRYLSCVAKPGVFFDVGAHIGNHAVAFALTTAAEQVYAIEPNVRSFRYLQQNSCATGTMSRIIPIGCAVHDTWKKADVSDLNPSNSGMCSIVEGDTVEVETLDNLTGGLNVSLLKVDVEGCELAVLRSGRKTLEKKSLAHVVVEVSLDTDEAVAEFLGSYGFIRGRRFNDTPTYVFERL